MNFTTKAQEHSCHSTTILLATLRIRECIPWSAQLLITILHQLQPEELYQRKRWKGLHDKEFSILAPPLKIAGGLPTEQNNKSKTEKRSSTWNVLCAFLPPYSLDCFSNQVLWPLHTPVLQSSLQGFRAHLLAPA